MTDRPLIDEDAVSQVPALQLLQNLGWTYLSPEEALALRGGRKSGVVLDGILEKQLRLINHIVTKGKVIPFSENNIAAAILALKDFSFEGLVRTNEKVYDLLCLGKGMQQTILGDTKSYTLQYIDWENPANNAYHVTEEFPVERSGSQDTYRPDLVLFVNGIPLVVIECKRPDLGPGKDPMKQAISQQIRNQKDDGIPHLFQYSQLLLCLSVNQARYGTTGTEPKFWSVWKEEEDERELSLVINAPLPQKWKEKLFIREGRKKFLKKHFDAMEENEPREVTEQDRALYALCRPNRLLEIAHRYIVFDAGVKKVARYQQYFCVEGILKRIRKRTGEGARKGGVVWHTQGSGKSLTMVMLAKSIAMDTEVPNPKIVLVTDRVDLDEQIYNTFQHCGEEVTKARTGKHLVELLESKSKSIITTVIDKFEAAAGQTIELDENTFVLVDEGHRGQYRSRHAKMRKSMKLACFIGFTGTPIMKKDRDTFQQFGGLIAPSYTITDAVRDKAVVPLIYEGRDVPQSVDAKAIDGWFEKLTRGLTDDQVVDLKRKFTTADQINKAEQKIRMIAWDVSSHFDLNWKGTGFKAQLVAPGRPEAVKYKQFLDEFGMVNSEVVISGPDTREDGGAVDKKHHGEVFEFWDRMMNRFGSEAQYNKALIDSFKHGDDIDIIIVVDKLLTGFDAPRNTVLYLCKKIKEHNLLQAIARVNRLHEGKDFGYIMDYRGVLGELDDALDFYGQMTDFEKEDIAYTVTPVTELLENLPQKHSDLWDVFKTVGNKKDREAYELLLKDEELRVTFYDKFSAFSRLLGVALSSVTFLEEASEERIKTYKADLKFFKSLRESVRIRYAEVVDYSEYEPRIKKLIDTHLGSGEVETITGAIDLFNKQKREEAIASAGGDAAVADTIASNTKRGIEVNMEKDPAFYKKFSRLLEEAIAAFHDERRIQAAEYRELVEGIMQKVLNRTDEDLPAGLVDHDMAQRYYGIVLEAFGPYDAEGFKLKENSVKAALAIEQLIQKLYVRDWTRNTDQKNKMIGAIEDYLFEQKDVWGIDLPLEVIDQIMNTCLDIAGRVKP